MTQLADKAQVLICTGSVTMASESVLKDLGSTSRHAMVKHVLNKTHSCIQQLHLLKQLFMQKMTLKLNGQAIMLISMLATRSNLVF